MREVLKDPRKTFPVFWAGEATAPAYHRDYHPLAVHGAYISGIEVAKDVHHFLKAGMTPAKFGTYYREKYKDVTKIPVKKKAAELVSFKFTEEETRRLKIYARAHTGCDLNEAARELLTQMLRTQLSVVRKESDHTRIPTPESKTKATTTIRVQLDEDEEDRLLTYAQAHTRGKLNHAGCDLLRQMLLHLDLTF